MKSRLDQIREIAERRNRLGMPIIKAPVQMVADSTQYAGLKRLIAQIESNLEWHCDPLMGVSLPQGCSFELLRPAI